MKKTLIAASIAALAAGSVQAVELYSSDTGSFSTYGKIQLQLNNFDGENEIQDNGSRFGFSGETAINSDLTAFANAEFRFNAGFHNDSADIETRYTYAGLTGGFGTVTAGNFDSVYYTAVAGAADILEQDGWNTFDDKGEGFSLSYVTPSFNGLQVLVGLRHYNSPDSRNGAAYPSNVDNTDEVWNIQVGAVYSLNDALSFSLAFDQNNEDIYGPGADTDAIIGAGVTYAVDQFSVFGVLELEGSDYTILNVGGSFNYGAGDIYGVISYQAEDDGVDDETGVDFVLGANYFLADNFYFYGEVAVGNDDVSGVRKATAFDTSGDPIAWEGVTSITLGASYNW